MKSQHLLIWRYSMQFIWTESKKCQKKLVSRFFERPKKKVAAYLMNIMTFCNFWICWQQECFLKSIHSMNKIDYGLFLSILVMITIWTARTTFKVMGVLTIWLFVNGFGKLLKQKVCLHCTTKRARGTIGSYDDTQKQWHQRGFWKWN